MSACAGVAACVAVLQRCCADAAELADLEQRVQAQAQRAEGDSAVARRDYAAAEAFYSSSLALRPGYVPTLLARASARLAAGALDGTLEDAAAVVAAPPADAATKPRARASLLACRAHCARGDVALAKAALDAAAAVDGSIARAPEFAAAKAAVAAAQASSAA